MPRPPLGDRVRLYGIRHHGPGSARSLLAALESWHPDAILLEGPAEAGALLPLLVHPEMRPPVAMLFYAEETPRWAAYYPLAEFSPELQAVRWAAEHGVPVRLMDLPASAMLGFVVSDRESSDAMELIAEATGFDDVEDWWEHLVEQRSAHAADLFEGLETLMTALRESDSVDDGETVEDREDGRRPVSDRQFEAIREAHMRRTIREALAANHERIAVVGGAWHVPALRELPPARHDEALLKGLPRLKVEATVVPWSFDRLTAASGYGAGARSPAFYDLLWRTPPTQVTARWLLAVAHLMRDEDLDASPASVIEAVRLAEALAALRGRTKPGLRELCESANSVLVRDAAIWSLIGRRLIVGEQLGEVPQTVPTIPLLADLNAHQRRLRLKQDETDRKLELDLRGDMDRDRSRLFHRLQLLGVPWGVEETVSGKGTFHEHWRIRWQPELTIQLIEAGVLGNTILAAASRRAVEQAESTDELAEIASLYERVLLADLVEAIEPTISKLQALSATGADILDLAAALPPLAAVVRYGTVRGTHSSRISPVLDAIFTRLCVGLPGACLSLDDDTARLMVERLGEVSTVVRLLDEPPKVEQWLEALAAIAAVSNAHPLVIGKAERLRFDFGAVDSVHLSLRIGQEASAGATALETAAFIEGLLDGPGMILLHQEPLFRAIDQWLVELDATRFDEVLPLVRRTFALFTRPERRQFGERVTRGVTVRETVREFDDERARRVLPIVRQILGLEHE